MGIQLTEREIDVYIALHQKRYKTLSELANDTGLSLVAVSRAVQSLERDDILTCQRQARRVLPETIQLMPPAEVIKLLPCHRILVLVDNS